MYQHKLICAFILFILCIGIRCQSGEDREDSLSEPVIIPHYSNYRPYSRYYHRRSCDTKTQIALAEVKSEIQDLQKILIGLRQKLDPDFKVPTPRTTPRTVHVPEVEPKCPPGFQYVNQARSCYKVVYEEHNWTTADQRCHDIHPGAHLVAITNSDENSALMTYLGHELAKNSHINVCKLHAWGDPQKMLWTSGQRRNETSCEEPVVWKISNETQLPLSFTYWHPGEPNCRNNEEYCIHIRPSQVFYWNDISCDHKICPLCESDPL